jgi:ribosomal-protein-alanine N-acetyltransferase
VSAVVKGVPRALRPMRAEDLDSIMAIELRAYEFPWTTGIFQDCLRHGYCMWLYEDQGDVMAYGVMQVAAGEAHLLNLCVAPEQRRSGLGRRLLLHLIEIARRHGADTFLLEVRPSNHAALELYRAQHFNEVGLRRNYYPTSDGREDALILARAL